ncbi:MAG: FRG domain-containing protein [Acidobacteriota bacterium]
MAISSKEWRGRLEKFGRELHGPDGWPRYDASLLDLAKETKVVASWQDFQRWIEGLKGKWCFRGHAEEAWFLSSSLDREIRRFRRYKNGGGNNLFNFRQNEDKLLIDFQRGAHHYYAPAYLPERTDQTIDWLALMQHHGAPTRLLDWTISPYVGLWMALEDGRLAAESDSCLWAIDLEWLEQRSEEILKKHDAAYPADSDFYAKCNYLNGLLLKQDNPQIIFHAQPFQVNQRMTAQQGLFLCNLSDNNVFSVALRDTILRKDLKPPKRQMISRVIIKRSQRIKFLEELRMMNIHYASLFPGSDGFAKSLRSVLEIRLEHELRRIEKEHGPEMTKLRKVMKKAGLIGGSEPISSS